MYIDLGLEHVQAQSFKFTQVDHFYGKTDVWSCNLDCLVDLAAITMAQLLVSIVFVFAHTHLIGLQVVLGDFLACQASLSMGFLIEFVRMVF